MRPKITTFKSLAAVTLELLRRLDYTLDRESCPYCGHPGTSSKDDNSDWEERHDIDCDILRIRALIAKLDGGKK